MDPDTGRRYAEEVGVALARMGTTPAFGKLLGWLLVCDPPCQTSAQLGAAVGLSRASVSAGMRTLERSGLVRRVPTSDRGHAYEIQRDAFARVIDPTANMRVFIELMQRGIDLIGAEDAPRADRLRHARDFYAFMIERVPGLMEEFHRHHAKEE